ncbi:hypothetical protein CRV24_007548 [Beauveria bassiana]|nr:hypothetical protein CRV24_007548 [Beauveria bassiana]
MHPQLSWLISSAYEHSPCVHYRDRSMVWGEVARAQFRKYSQPSTEPQSKHPTTTLRAIAPPRPCVVPGNDVFRQPRLEPSSNCFQLNTRKVAARQTSVFSGIFMRPHAELWRLHAGVLHR